MVHTRQRVREAFLVLLTPIHALSKHSVRRNCASWRRFASPSGRATRRHAIGKRRPCALNGGALFLDQIIVGIFSTAGGGDTIVQSGRAQLTSSKSVYNPRQRQIRVCHLREQEHVQMQDFFIFKCFKCTHCCIDSHQASTHSGAPTI